MPISALPVPVRRAGYRVAHAGLRVYWRIARPQTRGVKCVVRDGDAVVFVRHAYGDRRLWELPGGGIKRGEDPRDTAAREAREELGLDLEDWRALGSVESHGYGKRTTVTCFEAHAPTRALTVDPGEIEEAGWFALADPPAPLGLDARVVLTRLVLPAS
ncbi:MAG TPA: NUDIX domain-containing protein [Solirubrobacteraceae bacterium]